MSPSIAGFAARLVGADDRLLAHVACEKCGYDLRGSLASATCPECGTLVGVSLSPDRLSFADAAWLARVRNGLNWCLVGGLMAVGLGVIMIVTIAATGAADDVLMSAMIEWCFGIPPGLVIARGIWRLTSPEPGDAGPLEIARAISRWSAMFTTVCAVLALPAYVVLVSVTGGYDAQAINILRAPDAAALALIGMGGLSTIAFGFSTLVFAKPIARRARSKFVSWLNVIVTWCCAILCVAPPVGAGLAAGIFFLIANYLTAASRDYVGIGTAIVFAIGLVAWLILLVLIGPAILVLALGYRHLMTVAAKHAASLYSDTPAPAAAPSSSASTQR